MELNINNNQAQSPTNFFRSQFYRKQCTKKCPRSIVVLIIQHNYRCRYKSIAMALKIVLNIQTKIILLQKLFIGNWELVHSTFNFYWLLRDRTTIRVIIEVRKNLLDKIVIEHKTNLVNYFYFISLEIQDLNQQSKWPGKKTQLLNTYNKEIRQGYS